MKLTLTSRRLCLVPSRRTRPLIDSDPVFAPAPSQWGPGHPHPRTNQIVHSETTDDEPLWQTILGCIGFSILYGLALVIL